MAVSVLCRDRHLKTFSLKKVKIPTEERVKPLLFCFKFFGFKGAICATLSLRGVLGWVKTGPKLLFDDLGMTKSTAVRYISNLDYVDCTVYVHHVSIHLYLDLSLISLTFIKHVCLPPGKKQPLRKMEAGQLFSQGGCLGPRLSVFMCYRLN